MLSLSQSKHRHLAKGRELQAHIQDTAQGALLRSSVPNGLMSSQQHCSMDFQILCSHMMKAKTVRATDTYTGYTSNYISSTLSLPSPTLRIDNLRQIMHCIVLECSLQH
jgi:hypothetical protein